MKRTVKLILSALVIATLIFVGIQVDKKIETGSQQEVVENMSPKTPTEEVPTEEVPTEEVPTEEVPTEEVPTEEVKKYYEVTSCLVWVPNPKIVKKISSFLSEVSSCKGEKIEVFITGGHRIDPKELSITNEGKIYIETPVLNYFSVKELCHEIVKISGEALETRKTHEKFENLSAKIEKDILKKYNIKFMKAVTLSSEEYYIFLTKVMKEGKTLELLSLSNKPYWLIGLNSSSRKGLDPSDSFATINKVIANSL